MSEPTNGNGGGEPRVRPVGAVARPAGAAARPVPAARAAGAVRPEAASRAAPDWDLVRKRNNVEKLKYEKHPLKILDEVPALGEMDYNDVSEEDMVRFQWYGLYHDKPKVGLMMLRIKVPAGILTPAQLRVIGELSSEVRARLRRAVDPPDDPAPLAAHPRPAGGVRGAGERRDDLEGRLRRRRPQRHRLPGRRPRRDRAVRLPPRADRDRQLLRQPRRVPGPAAQAQDHDGDLRRPVQRARDQLHLVRRGASQAGRRAARVRGPRRRRALLDAAHRPRPRRLHRQERGAGGRSGDPGRLAARPEVPGLAGKGAPEVPGRRLRRGGRPQGRRGAAGPQARRPGGGAGRRPRPPTTSAIHPQKERGKVYIGVPVFAGQINAKQAIAIADLAESFGGDIRVDPPAELHPDRRPGRAHGRGRRRSWPRSASRWTSTSFAAPASPARASRSATTRWPRPSRRCARSWCGWRRGSGQTSRASSSAWTAARTPAPTTGSPTSASRGRRRAATACTKLEAYEIYLRGGLGVDAADRAADPAARPGRRGRGRRRAAGRGLAGAA